MRSTLTAPSSGPILQEGWIQSSPAIGTDGTIYNAINPYGILRWSYFARSEILSSPTIGIDGTIYVGSADGILYGISSSSLGLAESPWPKFQHDVRNNGSSLYPFADVPPVHWAHAYITAIFNTGYTNGYGGTNNFMPDLNATREQIAAFIIRAKEGEPAADYCSSGVPFTDVAASDWVCKYVKRLYELGITTGYGGTTRYMPDLDVTRAQMAAFLARAFLGL